MDTAKEEVRMGGKGGGKGVGGGEGGQWMDVGPRLHVKLGMLLCEYNAVAMKGGMI